MRKIFLCGMLWVVLLTVLGCRDYLDFSNEDEKGVKGKGSQQETSVVFDNRGADNIVPVTVYSNANRTESSYIMSVPKNSQSSPQVWQPAPDGYNFYITYDLYFQDDVFSSGKINIPYSLADPVSARIDAAKTTTILIPSLLSKIGGVNVPLSQDKYLVIKADGASFRLQKSSTNITPIQGDSSLINAGETAVYKLSSSDNITSYSISNKSFPTDNPVQSGHITFFAFNGSSISYRDEKAITINNLSVAP